MKCKIIQNYSLISLSISTARLLASTISRYSGSASTGPTAKIQTFD